MAVNAFSKAMNDANISVRLNSDGNRSVGQNSYMDQHQTYRGRGNNNRSRGGGGRWQRGYRGRGRGNRGGRGRGQGNNARSRFEEDEEGDFKMDNDRSRRGRYSTYGGARGGSGSRTKDRSPENKHDNDGEWWRITIPDGKKHNRGWLISKLKQMCSEPFCEVDFHFMQDTVIFFVNNESAANSLRSQSNRITVKDGSKLFISVKPSRAPKNPDKVGDSNVSNNGGASSNNNEVETIPERIEVLKNCLGNRYDMAAVKLDLSNLYGDKILRAGHIEGKANNPKLMNTIFQIVNKLCPDLKVIDLSNNRIQHLDVLNNLSDLCPNLEEINLSNNMIRFTGELSKIKSHKKITKLWFVQNPAHEQFKSDNVAYFSDIRTHLPELKELDGAVLPPPIKFDLQTESTIPPTLGNYFVNEQASKLVITFLKNFFQVYDSEDVNERQQLLPAYHSDAVFSMCCNTGVFTNDKDKGNMEIYSNKNRNLKRLKDKTNIRNQLIKHKKLSVVAFLVELPQTKHQLDSFILDVTVVTAECIIFSVHGIFFEGNEKKCRGFSRTFIAVPESNSQFLIINDQLHVRSATENQLEKLKGVPDTIGQSNSSTNQNSSYTSEQEVLIKRFSVESGMNIKWSTDALQSNSWNYEQAALKFADLRKNNQIPAEAFA